MLRIAVETRASTVLGHAMSLSVFLRMVRPLRRMAELGRVSLRAAPADELIPELGSGFDILVVNRPTRRASLDLIGQARARGIAVIIDIDDWMHGAPGYGAHLLHSVEFTKAGPPYLLADVMTVSTAFLAQVLAPMAAASPFIVPYGYDFNGVDREMSRSAAKTIMLSSMFTLKLGTAMGDFSRALLEFLDANPDWSVDFYCENFDSARFVHSRINIRAPVLYQEYLALLASERYAFSIVPLSGYEDEQEIVFNACKAPLKFVDYGANRLPGIYSRSPAYEAVVVDRRSGLLVDNSFDAWFAALAEMAADDGLRDQLAKTSYETVRSHFSLEQSILSLEAAFRGAMR